MDYQLSDLIKSHPKLRVALITFSNMVSSRVPYFNSRSIKSPILCCCLAPFYTIFNVFPQVNVIGDGSGETVSFGDRMLNDLKSIMVTGEDMVLPGLVEETGLTLAKKVAG